MTNTTTTETETLHPRTEETDVLDPSILDAQRARRETAAETAKPRTDDGGEILDPAILERQAARRAAYKAAGITPEMAALGVYPCRVPHLNATGRATNHYSRGEVVAVEVNLDGEGARVDVWSPAQVERIG